MSAALTGPNLCLTSFPLQLTLMCGNPLPLALCYIPTSVVVSTPQTSLSWECLNVKHARAGMAGTPR